MTNKTVRILVIGSALGGVGLLASLIRPHLHAQTDREIGVPDSVTSRSRVSDELFARIKAMLEQTKSMKEAGTVSELDVAAMERAYAKARMIRGEISQTEFREFNTRVADLMGRSYNAGVIRGHTLAAFYCELLDDEN